MFNFSVDYKQIESTFTNIKDYDRKIKQEIGYRVWQEARRFQKELKSEIYSGSNSFPGVKRYSGRLAKSVDLSRVVTNDGVEVTLDFDPSEAPHINTHIGPYGSKIHITPNSKSFLAIPVGGRKSHYYGRSPSETGESFWTYRSKKGNLLLFKKKESPKKNKPVYILKKSVNVKRRIHLRGKWMQFEIDVLERIRGILQKYV